MQVSPHPRMLPSGDTALVVEFGDVMDRRLSALVLNLAGRVRDAAIEGVVEAVPTFRSLMVHYDPLVVRASELEARLADLATDLDDSEVRGRHWVFPTCYEGDCAPDLDFVAEAAGLNAADTIALHASVPYLVYVIGFLPGYPYMGELPERLRLPRRTSPRVSVPTGSVAIATNQTGIYSMESPGGWHIIGRTAVPLFDPRRADPVLLAPGDTVRFEPVDRARHDAIATAAAEGMFDIASLRECR